MGAAIGFMTSDPTPDSHKIGARLRITAVTVINLGTAGNDEWSGREGIQSPVIICRRAGMTPTSYWLGAYCGRVTGYREVMLQDGLSTKRARSPLVGSFAGDCGRRVWQVGRLNSRGLSKRWRKSASRQPGRSAPDATMNATAEMQ